MNSVCCTSSSPLFSFFFFFFFNDTATTEIYTLSLHDALPIFYESPSNENGFQMLRALLGAVVRVGHEGTVLLLDEAERRLSVEAKPTKASTETIDHLRELVDLCGKSELPRTLILYAVTPAFTQHVL